MRVTRRSYALVLGCLLVACRNQAPLPPGPPVADGKGPLPVIPSPPAVAADSGRLLLAGAVSVLGEADGRLFLTAGVAARNASAQPRSLAGVCVVQVRAFPGSGATAPVWALPRLPASSCPPPPGAQEIGAGQRYPLAPWDGFPQLPLTALDGGQLHGGDYRFEALVRVGADTMVVPEGTLRLPDELRPPLRDPAVLAYAVDTRLEGVSPPELVTRVAATNATDRSVYLEYGDCSMALRAYRTPERTGRPVWRSEAAGPPGEKFPRACELYLAMRVLLPGASMLAPEHTRHYPVEEILGDTLPDGRYYFTAVLSFENVHGPRASDSVRVLAGDALLSSQIDSLPAEDDAGGLHYAAHTAPDPSSPGTLRVTVTVTNPGSTRTLLLGSGGTACSSQLVGYATREQRDRWYVQRSAGVAFSGCPLSLPPAWLAPGESRSYAGTVTPPAGARGRFYLALVLWTDQEPPAERSPTRVVLSAGDVTLGG